MPWRIIADRTKVIKIYFMERTTMKEFNAQKYKNMVRTFQENDNPLGWFDSIYSDTEAIASFGYEEIF
jgi:hypothetical protein